MSGGLFESIRISGTGMHAQRTRMDTVSRNLANAETTRTPEGTPYRRQRAVFSEVLESRLGRLRSLRENSGRGSLAVTHAGHSRGGLRPGDAPPPEGVEVAVGTAPDASDFRLVYDPGHPDADEEGYVLLPNVDVVTEMVDLIAAARAYEANVSAVQAAKDMFTRALDI